jgi:transcriptional regulator with XRE-family HTH domain
MNTYEIIKERAKLSGISLVQLCIKVGIARETLENWKEKEPKTLVILQKINDVLANAEEEKFNQTIKRND